MLNRRADATERLLEIAERYRKRSKKDAAGDRDRLAPGESVGR